VTEEAIAALEREWTRGVWSADDDAVDQFLAADFTCVTSVEGPQFRIETREAWVERLKRSETRLRIDDVAVAVYDGLAIATVLATEVAKEKDSTSERVFCDVWIKADGSWRLAERRESRPIQQ
jgi:ketosteroid isomerase-like protein